MNKSIIKAQIELCTEAKKEEKSLKEKLFEAKKIYAANMLRRINNDMQEVYNSIKRYEKEIGEKKEIGFPISKFDNIIVRITSEKIKLVNRYPYFIMDLTTYNHKEVMEFLENWDDIYPEVLEKTYEYFSIETLRHLNEVEKLREKFYKLHELL